MTFIPADVDCTIVSARLIKGDDDYPSLQLVLKPAYKWEVFKVVVPVLDLPDLPVGGQLSIAPKEEDDAESD